MLDIRYIRENQTAVDNAMINRGAEVDLVGLLKLDDVRKKLITQAEEMKAQKNEFSKRIGEILKSGGNADDQKTQVREIGKKIAQIDEKIRNTDSEILDALLYIPNIPSDFTPIGKSEEDNPVIRTWGDSPSFSFKPKPHWEIGVSLGLFDLDRGAKISGSGFPLYKGTGARLERALINFMLDFHIENHGYVEVAPPYFCNQKTMIGTGQLPKFAEDMYAIPEDGLYAIPTAEVPVTNMYSNEILDEPLPIMHVAYTPCFRREAGAAGKDTRGLQRLHQFDKVELVKFVQPEEAAKEHDKLTANAEAILQALNLPYRVIELCTADLGFSAKRCYDIEVWAPSQEKWLEVSSCSDFGDYQARRANIRFRDEQGKARYVHTLNGSGVALPRLMIALLENGQHDDGSVDIPQVLSKYMGGLDCLTV